MKTRWGILSTIILVGACALFGMKSLPAAENASVSPENDQRELIIPENYDWNTFDPAWDDEALSARFRFVDDKSRFVFYKRAAWMRQTAPARPVWNAPPNPDMVLWHTYNELDMWEDVLDWSRHGSIGEFNTADKLRTDTNDSFDKGLRLYSEFKKGRCLGYHILPTDTLTLRQGTVSFWMMVDSDIKTKRGIIFAAGRRRYIGASNSKKGVSITVTFGKKSLEYAGLETDKWYHVAWVFDKKSQQLYLDGKLVKTQTAGAALDGSGGFFVGHDGSKWAKTRSGGNGFAGVLEDLRIFNKKMTAFPGLADPPDPQSPKKGLVLWYDFEDQSATDKSGMGLDGMDTDIIAKDVPGWQKWKKGDTGWRFEEVRQAPCSCVKMPIDPKLDISSGTMELRFNIKKFHITHSDATWHVFASSSNSDPNHSADELIYLRCYSKENGDDVSPPQMKVLIRSKSNNKAIVLDRNYEIGEWIKLVIVWKCTADATKSSIDVWLNDKYMGHYDRFQFKLHGNRGLIRLGMDRDKIANSQGMDGIFTDIKIYNYYRSVYLPD